MKLASKTRCGIRTILQLALEYRKEPLQIKVIAERENISNKYLEQLISMLKTAGLVRSIRGPRGGYMLAKSPAEIPLIDVFLALEGQMLPAECHEHPEYASHCSGCMTRQIWQELQSAIAGTLEKVTLAELLERSS